MKAAIFAIDRIRMGTDGPGVTTLVTFMGCLLHCKYCLNPKCHEPIYEADGKTPRRGIMLLTPQELYDMVRIDNIYFQATGGGICFGGGEPGIQSEFIAEFRKLCGDKWKITIETSGEMSRKDYERLAPIVDLWILDIKTFNLQVYKQYTGKETGVIQALSWLKELVGVDKVIVKVPHIPDFTTDEMVEKSIQHVRVLGFWRINEIQYVRKISQNSK